ncbi:DUF456 domain-containing protein [Epilithonimonas arachidiradicis]|uniref:DUF456 domain-containing protein n=1 Tax=Epilithonimonas arachidiradicis TaxID=1617282 RepID=A0A420DAX7_9FLAO|nr:DUF456 domain-containing protein [Epilithonimonas arachidiradicis]RKE88382.1 hypothetical protein BXY58_1533 [Epilithonimonas arachidiradicis]GGG49331.1 hypothetical protein GCM10007332_08560 [Epilithonimonas arachidiradicis]
MDSVFIDIIALVLLFVGMLGTFLPVLPGLLLSICGLLIFKFGTENNMPMVYVWIFAFLTLVSTVLNYVIPAKTNKKYGGTRYGSIGSFIGTLLGFFFIHIPLGFLIGMLLGVFLGELLHDVNDRKKAFNSMKGAFIGFVYGTGFSLMVGLAMFLVVGYYIFF